MIYYMNGDWVESSQASLPISDLSISRGVALFESLKTYHKKPFRLHDHVVRITKSAEEAGFKEVADSSNLEQLVLSGIEKNYSSVGELVVKILITAGSGTLTEYGNSRLIIMFDSDNSLPQQKYDEGLSILSYNGPRFLAHQKHTNYFSAALGMQIAKSKGMDDIFYRDAQNNIYESSTGNIFVYTNGQLITPSDNILQGLTRSVVINEVAPSLGMQVQQVNVSYDDLIGSDEVFITGSIKEVIAVTNIDGKPVSAEVGPITKSIQQKFKDIVEEELK